MLPLPDLDDRFFEEIVKDSRKKIPRLTPRWTDENYHDPGITLIELFAWLTEMQQYYLNRITPQNELKFLKLLGMSLREASPARADVTFNGVADQLVLPRATRLAAQDRLFETGEPLLLVPARIEKVIVCDRSGSLDYTSANSYSGVTFHAFGREAARGNRLYIGFDRALPLNREIFLTINLFEDYPVPLGGTREQAGDVIPPARVSWKFYGPGQESDKNAGWLPLELVGDGTAHMSRGGRVTFRVPGPMHPTVIHPASDRGRYWICCAVEEEGYPFSPKVDSILINTVSCVQCNTLSAVFTFSGSGEPGQTFEVDHCLAYYGHNRVQVRDGEGNWRYWEKISHISGAGHKLCYTIEKNPQEKKTALIFGDGDSGAVPHRGEGNIRLISYSSEFAGLRYLGRSNGLPNQLFSLSEGNVDGKSLIIQVSRKIAGSEETVWEDWELVEDFDLSGPADRHFIYNPATGEIRFGNNDHGSVPGAGEEDNICIISCRAGGGDGGNIRENEIKTIVDRPEELMTVEVLNRLPASGGTERETIEEAKGRMRTELKKQYRAVTSEDYEEAALATPGLRVARVKAIPLFYPGLKDYPQNKAKSQVSVVVVPYSDQPKPVPGKSFLQTVRRHLEKYRLVTTELHVIPPEYIKISVHAVVAIAPHISPDPQAIAGALEKYLDPLGAHNGSGGMEFGRTVYKGDVYSVINAIDGVEYIKDLWFEAEGAGVIREQSGDIKIPPHGLVYSGVHYIETVSRRDL
ncbi:MAG: hypothetical protein JL50_17970 [Peptococcaceae bacterium BICA1-7]|nr:MAG: hypothetical protein JL50_17970 [Peptococcaceae bacterium BICA1-7]HBV97853.1 putative baseplate assembly protein [Desulfotomaculum sp.]